MQPHHVITVKEGILDQLPVRWHPFDALLEELAIRHTEIFHLGIQPGQVLIDNLPVQELSRDRDGILWTLVPEGIHRIVMTGKTGPGNSIQIPLPLNPHSAAYSSKGWDVQGIHKDGKVESGIQLTRLKKEKKDKALSTSVSLPPFMHVERVIRLGLNWEMTTTVTRVTPAGTPVVISLPLIEGESVTSAGIRVENGKALVNMDPKANRIWWDLAY